MAAPNNGDVWLFFHAADLSRSRPHRDRVAGICSSRGWGFQSRRVERRKSALGRPLPMVEVDVAAGLYPRVHRRRLVVLVIGRDPLVPLHPRIEEATMPKKHVPLRRFVSYKSLWIRLPADKPQDDTWAGRFESWSETIDCEGEHDPRCLPFHVFSGDGRGLDKPERRSSFDDRYGSGSSRTDEKDAAWRMEPSAFHALQEHDELNVSGCVLRRGCHWDVEAREYRISTPRGVWVVDGHVNVYPDANIRGSRPAVKQLI